MKIIHLALPVLWHWEDLLQMLSMVCPAVREAGIPPWGWEASENRTEGL
jgi:hypothetical protein